MNAASLPSRGRRRLLGATLAGGALALLPATRTIGSPRPTLRLAPTRQALAGAAYPQTEVWSYGGTIPGPLLRYRQGERLRIEVDNALPDPTTVHFHGIRLPNAMDGVPHLTQPPIEPGSRFVYEFDLPDAGTYWYHPHLGSSEQLGRGLAGALIVEEADPYPVDRDLLWMLTDWRLDREARIVENFGNSMDQSHGGRIGNTVTLNGEVRETVAVQAGERIRLRLVNASNARIYALSFTGHEVRVIAHDGHAVEPHRPEGDRVVLGPAMRVDLLIDLNGDPGMRYPVRDLAYPRQAYRLVDLAYGATRATGRAGSALPVLEANRLPEPDLDRAERHRIEFGGGMMGRMPRGFWNRGMSWTVNGSPVRDHDAEPILKLARNRSCILELLNETAWPHPIHLHGHVFRVIRRDGGPTRHREWRDTVLLPPRSSAEIAFVADNPGGWMFHCHVLEHQESGMMAVIEVA